MKLSNTIAAKNISVTHSQLTEWLKMGRNVYILDIRPEEERREWSIPESEHSDLYEEVKSGNTDLLNRNDLPDDRPIVTVCGAGKTSLMAAEALRKQGREAYSLDGGMKAWNFTWDTAEEELDSGFSLVQVRRVAKGCLSYIIGSGDEAVVIDASLDPDIYINLARQNGWTIRYVMDTHLHADYVSRTRELSERTGTKHLMYRDADTEFDFSPVEDKKKIEFGNTSMTVLHTPGHTPESISFLIEDKAVFTGDTLFTDGVGRPDLKADKQQALRKAQHLYDSLQGLLTMDEAIKVFPAHVAKSIRIGDPMVFSTIGALSDSLEILSLSKEEFVQEVVTRIPPTPSNYQKISSLNKKGSYGDHRLEDLETGANRCAVG